MAPHADESTLNSEYPQHSKADTTNDVAQASTAHNGNEKLKSEDPNANAKEQSAPASNGDVQEHASAVPNGKTDEAQESTHHASLNPPLQLKGALNEYKSFDVTPVIGREFPQAKLADWLRAPNSDDLIRDLAITSQYSPSSASGCPLISFAPVSQRGVVFFRAQDGLDDGFQKELAQRLGELSGKPASSKLHIHPIINAGREDGGGDDEISVISSRQAKKLYKGSFLTPSEKRQNGKEGWHSDITFESVRLFTLKHSGFSSPAASDGMMFTGAE